MKVRWWHITVAGIGAIVLGLVAGKGVKTMYEVLIKRKRGSLTQDLYDKIQRYAVKYNVPMALALATVDVESGFDVNAYNPECEGGTKEYGTRVSYSPYVICKNESYRRWNSFNAKWTKAGAVDANKPGLWGSFGLMQVLPDTAWGWGYSKDRPNAGLFDVNTNLDVGMAKLGGAWENNGNAADCRCIYKYGKNYEKSVATYGKTNVDAVVNKFFDDYLSMYEKKFGLPAVKRWR